MPAEISSSQSGSRRIAWFGMLAILLVGVAVFTLSWASSVLVDDFSAADTLPNSGGVTVLPEVPQFATSKEMMSTPSLIPLDSATFNPPPSETSVMLDVLHIYEVTKLPAGTSRSFLIHMIVWGETLDAIAAKYGTTVEAIMAVNYKLTTPVWADYPIVIPVDTKDATGLPSFKVYVVIDYESISAEALANILGVDAKDFEYYNLCEGNCQFVKGDVLLVPHAP